MTLMRKGWQNTATEYWFGRRPWHAHTNQLIGAKTSYCVCCLLPGGGVKGCGKEIRAQGLGL